jgi:hypothetical protein
MIISGDGRASVLRDQEIILHKVKLPMTYVYSNSCVALIMIDGEPCAVIGGRGTGSGVYIRRAITLEEVKTLPYEDFVYSVCVNAQGTKVYFGTESGWI